MASSWGDLECLHWVTPEVVLHEVCEGRMGTDVLVELYRISVVIDYGSTERVGVQPKTEARDRSEAEHKASA